MILCPPDRSISYLHDLELGRLFLGESHQDTPRLRWVYARSLYEEVYEDPDATFDDLREAVNTLEEIEPTARRVLGGAPPIAAGIKDRLGDARAALHTYETQQQEK